MDPSDAQLQFNSGAERWTAMRATARQLATLIVGVTLGVAVHNVSQTARAAQPAKCEVPKSLGTLRATLSGVEARALPMPKSTAHLVFEDPDGVIRLVALDSEACSVAVTIGRP